MRSSECEGGTSGEAAAGSDTFMPTFYSVQTFVIQTLLSPHDLHL